MKKAIIWLKNDLRLSDNPSIYNAIKDGYKVIFLYILENTKDFEKNQWKLGAAQNWWLHYSLTSLSKKIKKFGGKLYLQIGIQKSKKNQETQ
jgi:deoxyribodipyrimidine photo-lyase